MYSLYTVRPDRTVTRDEYTMLIFALRSVRNHLYLLIFTRGLVYMDRIYSDVEGTTLTWVTGMHLKFDLEAPTQPILKT